MLPLFQPTWRKRPHLSEKCALEHTSPNVPRARASIMVLPPGGWGTPAKTPDLRRSVAVDRAQVHPSGSSDWTVPRRAEPSALHNLALESTWPRTSQLILDLVSEFAFRERCLTAADRGI